VVGCELAFVVMASLAWLVVSEPLTGDAVVHICSSATLDISECDVNVMNLLSVSVSVVSSLMLLPSSALAVKQEAKVIWQRLQQMHRTHCTYRRVEPHDRQTDGLTDWRTDTAIIGNNSLHLMHSMQPNKNTNYCKHVGLQPVNPVNRKDAKTAEQPKIQKLM